MVSAAVERWRTSVEKELQNRKIPLPSDLILAVIRTESGGKAGVVNKTGNASGLMQILPITLRDFNQRHGTSYAITDLQSDTEESVKKQIQVGIDVLSRYWQSAYKYLKARLGEKNVPIDDLSKIADLFYRAGPGSTQKKLDALSSPTFSLLSATFPDWKPLLHPSRVFRDEISWDIDKIGDWLEGSITKAKTGIQKIVEDPKSGFAFGILILMAAYWLMKKG